MSSDTIEGTQARPVEGVGRVTVVEWMVALSPALRRLHMGFLVAMFARRVASARHGAEWTECQHRHWQDVRSFAIRACNDTLYLERRLQEH